MGSEVLKINVKPPNTMLQSPYDTAYGLTNVVFTNPTQSYSNVLANQKPTEYTVTSCEPGNSDDNIGCLPGKDELQMTRPLLASRGLASTTVPPSVTPAITP